MLDHLSFCVKDYEKSLEFYDKTLATLGYERLLTVDIPEEKVKGAGYGKSPKPSLWIGPIGKEEEDIGRAKGVHIAFEAPSVEAVKTWYQTCLNLGGKDNGAPGPRAEYHPGYYGAFIIDPNGWRIEACLHDYNGVKSSFL